MDLNSKNTRNDRSRSRSRSHSIEKVKKILNLLEKSPSTSGRNKQKIIFFKKIKIFCNVSFIKTLKKI